MNLLRKKCLRTRLQSLEAIATSDCYASKGFSVVEILVVTFVMTTLVGIALPTLASALRAYRSNGDAKRISTQLSLARMRAAANSSPARVRFNLATSSFQLELYDPTSVAYQIEGDVQNLAGGDSYGYGSISIPAGAQTTMGQASQCVDGIGNLIAQTSCVVFNSRGIPIDSTGATTSNDVVYLANGAGSYLSVSVSPSGRILTWLYLGRSWKTI